MTPQDSIGRAFPPEYIRTAPGRRGLWRWLRGCGDYWVADDDGWCAGNLTRGRALDYARGRATLRGATVVARFDRRGVMHVVATFPE